MTGLNPALIVGCLIVYSFGTPIQVSNERSEVSNVSSICPGMQVMCHHDQKCCRQRDSYGGYACCPHVNGVCCGEYSKHCCPHDHTCTQYGCHHEENGNTLSNPLSHPFVRQIMNLVPAEPDRPIIIAAPQQKKLDLIKKLSEDYPIKGGALCTGNKPCPIIDNDGNTVAYTCCPYSEKATCCESWCCDEGFQCGPPQNQTCIPVKEGAAAISAAAPQKEAPPHYSATTLYTCPPGLNNTCTDDQTCCVTPEKHFSCAPFANATCCLDGVHSCPQGYKCDKDTNVCSPDNSTMHGLESKNDGNLIDCDSMMQCSDNQTCCSLTDGTFGCCPFKNATCCSDHIHCCPENLECDHKSHTCKSPKSDSSNISLEKVSTVSPADVQCKDGSKCPDGMTCCSIGKEQFGCCPFQEATCCSDMVHCCPKSTVCNTERGTCDPSGVEQIISKTEKLQASTDRPDIANIVCDGEMECSNNQTCCRLTDGSFGCCPFPIAVCCSDHVHCCPHEMWCDHKTKRCKNPGNSIPMGKKLPAYPKTSQPASSVPLGLKVPATKPSSFIDTILKPSSFIDTILKPSSFIDTILKPKSIPLGVKFPATKKAAGATNSIPLAVKIPAKMPSLVKVSDLSEVLKPAKTSHIPSKSVKCDDGSSCPTGTTCCKLSSGDWGCCPYPKAVCCDDGEHCCPQGYTCDVSGGTCDRGNTKSELTEPTIEAIKCDDGSICPSGSTCCKEASGGWACCPLPNAVCCTDLVHCCPNGYICDLTIGSCNKASGIENLLTELSVGNVKCDDGSSCPTGTTCCKLSSGDWGCCPYPKAVCCDDGEHCCPQGYTCDVSAGKCDRGNTQSELTELSVGSVSCDDGSSCPTGTTCCKLSSGDWGCCPYPKAVCCDDGEHCCPQGYTCDVSAGTCDRGNTQSELTELSVGSVSCDDGSSCPTGTTCCKLSSGDWSCCPYPEAVCCDDGKHCCPQGYTCDLSAGTCDRGNTQSELTELSVGSVSCDDGSSCPTGTTCCKLSSGDWGCCPYPKAVCCDDGEHCCPQGYKCDVSAGTCNRGNTQSELTELSVGSVKCDDGSSCPTGTTCCKLSSGDWGCCPYPKAVCCDDGEHCCPQGYTCDLSAGTCDRGNTQSELTELSVGSVSCDDGSSCPTGTTCCKLSSGDWGCCPYPEAVCCDDGKHCCPQGYTCDVSAGTCDRGNTQSELTELSVGSVSCDDGSSCPTGTTCCKLSSGDWGCCPYPKAVCCDDGEHCCPQGYTCDVSAGTCDRSNTQSELTELSVGSIKCDDGSSCPTGTTCCKLSSGDWGCCPYPEAVCCNDGEHCCPQGYTCDVSAGTCDRASTNTELTSGWYEECGDGTACPGGTSCCKMTAGYYGCCPYPNAVCCQDQKHCCPNGHTCDSSSKKCYHHQSEANNTIQAGQVMGDNTLQAGQVMGDNTLQAGQVMGDNTLQAGQVMGDNTLQAGQVMGDNTLQAGQVMGDNTLQAGQVMGDNTLQAGQVMGDNTLQAGQVMGEISPAQHIPSSRGMSNKSIPEEGSGDDGKGFCKDGKWCGVEKCCYDSDGKTVGCCKFVKGVCCSNGKNCCKATEICTQQGSCIPSNSSGIGEDEESADCTSCAEGDTCCSGQCCPQSNGVCCNDGVSCCPHQFECDLSRGRCIQRTTGRFQPISKLRKRENALSCKTLKDCGNGSFCPKDLECLNLFKLCYSTRREVHQNMIDDCE
ncbi:uncharacterized protein LOC134825040 isoform X3 [Bolinopsis microptera]|uniref:uncharacterized protein LOC134825040 isoform X3 n=1 Tax=Bolinopsis microptera TaxID=2820187 RepID=UPI003079E941